MKPFKASSTCFTLVRGGGTGLRFSSYSLTICLTFLRGAGIGRSIILVHGAGIGRSMILVRGAGTGCLIRLINC